MSLHQDRDEPFRTFATQFVRSKVETCIFTTVSECEFRRKYFTSYTEEAIKDVMLAGVDGENSRRVVLSTEDTWSRLSFELVYSF